MNDELAGLQSAATSLAELTRTITDAADRLLAAGADGAASDLYEVERALRNASRKLTRLLAAPRD